MAIERSLNAIRDIKDGPWCWQSKPALRHIRETFDSTHNVNSAIVVYVALTEVASDKESAIFQTTHGYLAQKSGTSVATVQRRLKVLEEIGVVKIHTPKLRLPCTYTLLPLSHREASLPHGEAALPHSEEQVQRGTLEEHKNNNKKKNKKKVVAKESRPTPKQTESEWLDGLNKSEAYADINVHKEFSKMVQWCRTNRKQATRKRFINWLNRIDTPMKELVPDYSKGF